MAIVKSEIEVTSSLPAAKLFKGLIDFDTIAPKVEPQVYKAIEIIEGDGGVGTVKSTTYGDAVPFTCSKHKIDSIDTDNFSVSYTIFEGDIMMGKLDSFTHHLKFIPSSDGGCVFKHTTEYHCKGDAQLTEEFVNLANEAHKKSFKEIEAYIIANPNAY